MFTAVNAVTAAYNKQLRVTFSSISTGRSDLYSNHPITCGPNASSWIRVVVQGGTQPTCGNILHNKKGMKWNPTVLTTKQATNCIFITFGRQYLESGICTLLGCYAAYSDNSLPTFWDKISFPMFKGQEIQDT
jgi:hypothetical protein